MKNKEKYEKEIAKLACNESDIAVSKATGNPINCNIIKCDCCALYKGGIYNDYTCVGAFEKWSESEYIEKPAISKKDKDFLDYIKEEFKYIARDENGKLFVYETQPKKSKTCRYRYWIGANNLCLNRYYKVDFPMIKGSDEEPWLIEDLKRLEVVDSYE